MVPAGIWGFEVSARVVTWYSDTGSLCTVCCCCCCFFVSNFLQFYNECSVGFLFSFLFFFLGVDLQRFMLLMTSITWLKDLCL